MLRAVRGKPNLNSKVKKYLAFHCYEVGNGISEELADVFLENGFAEKVKEKKTTSIPQAEIETPEKPKKKRGRPKKIETPEKDDMND